MAVWSDMGCVLVTSTRFRSVHSAAVEVTTSTEPIEFFDSHLTDRCSFTVYWQLILATYMGFWRLVVASITCHTHSLLCDTACSSVRPVEQTRASQVDEERGEEWSGMRNKHPISFSLCLAVSIVSGTHRAGRSDIIQNYISWVREMRSLTVS
jgi:hypothetical protein